MWDADISQLSQIKTSNSCAFKILYYLKLPNLYPVFSTLKNYMFTTMHHKNKFQGSK